MQNETSLPRLSGLALARGDQLGPNVFPVIRTQIAASDGAAGLTLQSGCQFCGASTQAVADVLQMSSRGAASGGNLITSRHVQRREVGFEVHQSITPNGAVTVNTVRCSRSVSTSGMDEKAQARVDRLLAWCHAKGIAMDGGKLSARLFTDYAKSKRLTGDYSYWAAVLAKSKHKSFSQKKAREVEERLGMPPFHLDGGVGVAVAPAMKVTDLGPQEIELILLFRELKEDHRDEIVLKANELHNIDHPVPSRAHPFAKAPKPGTGAKETPSGGGDTNLGKLAPLRRAR